MTLLSIVAGAVEDSLTASRSISTKLMEVGLTSFLKAGPVDFYDFILF